MQQHGVAAPDHPLVTPLRSAVPPAARQALALLLVPALLASLASRPAGAAPASPAGEAQMTLYSGIAALNVCIARAAGVTFDQAVAIAGETIAQLIRSQHGSVISLVGCEPLSIEDLRRGSINSAVLGAVEACPDQVPAAVRQSVQASLRQAEGATPTPRGR
jgi:hypothetical protein